MNCTELYTTTPAQILQTDGSITHACYSDKTVPLTNLSVPGKKKTGRKLTKRTASGNVICWNKLLEESTDGGWVQDRASGEPLTTVDVLKGIIPTGIGALSTWHTLKTRSKNKSTIETEEQTCRQINCSLQSQAQVNANKTWDTHVGKGSAVYSSVSGGGGALASSTSPEV